MDELAGETGVAVNGGSNGSGAPGEQPWPVGIYDSGLGGLTVVREVLRQMPDTPVFYLADTAHVPYGPRPAHEIRAFSRGIATALLREGATSIVAACNMSSALALPEMKREFSIPLIGMIGPGSSAALAADPNGSIGILATEGTCRSNAYPQRIREMAPLTQVYQSPCPRFVPLVESGRMGSPEARDVAREYLSPLLAAGCKTIILGCTHYPWLLPALQEVAGDGVRFVDPAVAAVEELKRRVPVSIAGQERPRHRFSATAHPERLQEGVKQWLQLDAAVERWPLWEKKTKEKAASPADAPAPTLSLAGLDVGYPQPVPQPG